MSQALIDQVSATVAAGAYRFTASGSAIKFPGFMTLYLSSEEESDEAGDTKRTQLPELRDGMRLKLKRLEPKQHFTMPPPRFSEASLVKELEENGIGRPSTYAAILSTIRDKGYVELIKGYFRPTELGFIVNDLLVENFPGIFDVQFTARMEANLDRVEADQADSLEILTRFYGPFQKDLSAAAENMLNVKGVGFKTVLRCPECGQPLHIKVGKNGPFLACSGYPDCSYSNDYERDGKGNIQPAERKNGEVSDKTCEKCGKPMVVKKGRFGDFLACSGYPDCKHTQSLFSNGSGQAIGVPCPAKGCTGEVVERQSRRGKIFYGCSRFPECDFATWDKPVGRPCPECGSVYLVEKASKKLGKYLACPSKDCGYQETVPETN
jgi:DNA topoisomerase-1